MKFIVAVDEKWGIGKDGDLLLSIPDDMRFFREATRNAVLVMGYNTLLSFPNSRPLFGRLNIVLADVEGLKIDGAVVCGSMDELFALLKSFDSDDVYVVGGGSMYRQLMPFCDTAYITKMGFDGEADTFIPNLDAELSWSIVSESEQKVHEGITYSFVEYHNSEVEAIDFGSHSGDMSLYFKKKAEIQAPYPENEGYRAELSRLTKAYFKPICGGISSADVKEFLSSSEPSFEHYLTEKGLIARQDDFATLAEKYSLNTDVTVIINKENYTDYI